MKIVSREEVTEKIDENTNRIVENIIEEFNQRKDPNIFFVSTLLYHGLSEPYLNMVINKLNKLLKDYKYVVSCDHSFCIKYVE